jgi:urate oxidase
MPKLVAHRYGKARVRVAKIFREKDRQSIKEIDVTVLLEGEFETSYTAGDNTRVVPTDTMKNTINVLAKDELGEENEQFASALGKHFLEHYRQVGAARVEIRERDWRRLELDGKSHPHTFIAGNEAKRVARVTSTRQTQTVESGIRDLLILKSTGSGFENYPKDQFTSLPETSDRILATSLAATWSYEDHPASYRSANDAIIRAMLSVFADNYSPSAQTTLFQMGSAALEVCPEISRIEMAMPNKHYLPIDLSRFGRENKNEIFTPTDEPHGQIEAVMSRDG